MENMYEYEVDKDGIRHLVKSINNLERSFIRFTNASRRPVDVFWINYMGKPEKYKQILPYQFFDVNTFTSHPWIFQDSITSERYVVNNQLVFRGQPNVKYSPSHLMTEGQRPAINYIVRINFNITAPLRNLKLSALVTLAEYIEDENVVPLLDLPKTLAQELSVMIKLYNNKI